MTKDKAAELAKVKWGEAAWVVEHHPKNTPKDRFVVNRGGLRGGGRGDSWEEAFDNADKAEVVNG